MRHNIGHYRGLQGTHMDSLKPSGIFEQNSSIWHIIQCAVHRHEILFSGFQNNLQTRFDSLRSPSTFSLYIKNVFSDELLNNIYSFFGLVAYFNFLCGWFSELWKLFPRCSEVKFTKLLCKFYRFLNHSFLFVIITILQRKRRCLEYSSYKGGLDTLSIEN